MSMALVSMAQVVLLMGTSAVAVSFCCSGGDDDEMETETGGGESDEAAQGTGEEVVATSPSSEGSAAMSKFTEMTADHPDLKFVLQFDGEVSEDFFIHLRSVSILASQYVWSVNKRMAANEAAWKDLAKRISTLQTEGFDVKPGSDAAKERRKLASQKNPKPRLLDQFQRKKKKKKSKKPGNSA